jgi:hypothetical protein
VRWPPEETGQNPGEARDLVVMCSDRTIGLTPHHDNAVPASTKFLQRLQQRPTKSDHTSQHYPEALPTSTTSSTTSSSVAMDQSKSKVHTKNGQHARDGQHRGTFGCGPRFKARGEHKPGNTGQNANLVR